MEVNTYRWDYSQRPELWLFLGSDLHVDAPDFDERALLDDLEEARRREAWILINGDVFDLILPKDIKRYSPDGRAQVGAIVNQAVSRATDLLLPYADLVRLIGVGNHETSVIKHNAVDPVHWLIGNLNNARKSNDLIRHAGYTGFVRIQGHHGKNSSTRTWDMWYNHGQGGQSEVTGGTIDLQRRTYLRVDFRWLGHKHGRTWRETTEVGLNHAGQPYAKRSDGVVTGTYRKHFRQYDIADTGYIVNHSEESFRVPHANGGAFVKLYMRGGGADRTLCHKVEV